MKQAQAYYEMLHGVEEHPIIDVTELVVNPGLSDVTLGDHIVRSKTRVSLTIRHVLGQ